MKTFYKLITASFIFCFSAFSSLITNAQPADAHAISTGASSAPRAIFENGVDTYALIGFTSYGFDSSFVSLVEILPGYVVGNHREYRTNFPLNFMNTAARIPEGYLMGGVVNATFGTNRPYIIRTDGDFEMLWSIFFPDLPLIQTQIIKILPNGSQYTAYTYSDSPSTGFYRITGDQDGTGGFETLEISQVEDYHFRIYNAVEEPNSGDHMVVGVSLPVGNTNSNGWVARIDDTGPVWSKAYDFGFGEETYNLVPTADGGFIFPSYSFNTVTTFYETCVTKVDADGSVIWCKRISHPSHNMYMHTIVETAAGDILLAGFQVANTLELVKLDADGNFIWAHQPPSGGLQYASTHDLVKIDGGKIMLIANGGSYILLEMDSEGDACDFVDTPGVQVADYVPVVTDMVLVATDYAATSEEQQLLDREQVVSSAPILCVNVDVAEEANNVIRVFPNPAQDKLILHLPENISTDAVLSIFDTSGKMCSSTAFTNEIDISGLAPGLYTVQVATGEKNLRVKFVKS